VLRARSHPRAVGAAAFTLVELMVALGIFAMVLAAIASTWSAILRASKVGLEAAAAVQRARMAARTLEEALGSTMAFAANQQYYAFVAQNGSEASLSFVARLAKSFPRSGKFGDLDVRRVTFSVESAPEGGRELVLRQSPLIMDPDEDEKSHPIVLAKNVKEFKMEFWDDTRSYDWSDEWEPRGTNYIPVMVKITLKLADNPYSNMIREQVTRIISLPCTTVQATWQPRQGMPGQPGGPGQPAPGQPPLQQGQPPISLLPGGQGVRIGQ